MKNESGKSIVTLVILTIFIMIGVSIIINYAKKMVEETESQDLKTNMLLMQAEVKKGLEEVCFNSVNLDKTKEEDIKKLNEIKQEYLTGTILNSAPGEVQEAVKNVPDFNFDDNCYYLDESTLANMGITGVSKDEVGYFIVKYDFTNADVEVINTKGYEGYYTLTQMTQTIDEFQS